MGEIVLHLVAAVTLLFVLSEKVVAILLHGGEVILQSINNSIGFHEFLRYILMDASNGLWPGLLKHVLEAFRLGN